MSDLDLSAAGAPEAGAVIGRGAGAWLREQRLSYGWSKAEMARRIHAMMSARGGEVPGVPSITRSLAAWEAGSRFPQDRWRAMLCQVLGVAVGDFPAAPRSAGSLAAPADLDPDDPRPWVQVARTLLEQIETGELKPGDPVPRSAEVASETGLSAPTVRRAYRYLQDHDVIRYWPGAGYHVSGQQPDGQRPEDPAQAGSR